MSHNPARSEHQEVTPAQLARLLEGGEVLVVDVREPNEFSAGHIPGAINMPLSSFQPSRLGLLGTKMLVLNCAAGRRSGMALEKCAAAQSEINTHLAGGFSAWTAAGLPVARS
jgi:rhodanese-related sulfurtransferase